MAVSPNRFNIRMGIMSPDSYFGPKMGLLRPENGHFEEIFLLITVTWLGPTPMVNC